MLVTIRLCDECLLWHCGRAAAQSAMFATVMRLQLWLRTNGGDE